ncbi:hypothetical protein [Haliangium sp.]|uniref:hypothetical protein n=1 Tax=Haliangium sp. TaxID=2663208 RepID=UPI003D134C63
MKLLPVSASALAALLLALPTAAHADHVIDDFSVPLPNGDLMVGRNSGNPFHFDEASQTNLGSSTISGDRDTLIDDESGRAYLNSVSIDYNELMYSTSSGSSGVLTLSYGELLLLNADLADDWAFAFDIDGNMYGGCHSRPVWLTVTVRSGHGDDAVTQQYTRKVVRDGQYTISFSNFDEIDFTDVTLLQFEFDASQVSGIDFALSNLRTI